MRIAHCRIAEGGRIPRGHGRAYTDFATGHEVCFPLPFNWLVRWARQLYWWLVWPKKDAMEKVFAAGVKRGREGLRESNERAYQRGVDEANEKQVAVTLDDVLTEVDKHLMTSGERAQIEKYKRDTLELVQLEKEQDDA